jgi:hypothetical protein
MLFRVMCRPGVSTRKRLIAVLLLPGLAGCFLGPADGLLVLEGSVSDGEGKPVTGCGLALHSSPDGRMISSQEVEPRLRADFVIGPGKREYYAEVSCRGHSGVSRSRPFIATGLADAHPVQLGEMRLPR